MSQSCVVVRFLSLSCSLQAPFYKMLWHDGLKSCTLMIVKCCLVCITTCRLQIAVQGLDSNWLGCLLQSQNKLEASTYVATVSQQVVLLMQQFSPILNQQRHSAMCLLLLWSCTECFSGCCSSVDGHVFTLFASSKPHEIVSVAGLRFHKMPKTPLLVSRIDLTLKRLL